MGTDVYRESKVASPYDATQPFWNPEKVKPPKLDIISTNPKMSREKSFIGSLFEVNSAWFLC